MNTQINRAFLETLSAYLAGTTDTESDRLFKTKMDEMNGSSERANLEAIVQSWRSLPKDRRISLTGVEEINMRSRLSSEDLKKALASTERIPTVAPGIRSRSFDTTLSLVPEHSGPFLPSHPSVMNAQADIAGWFLPGTVVSSYTVDWAGVYCVKETPHDQLSPHDEIYVIFSTIPRYPREPWTQRSNVEDGWDSGDDWRPFPDMRLFGKAGPEAPEEVAIMATVMEKDKGDPNKYRDEIHTLAKAGQAYAAGNGIPIPDFVVDLVTDFINDVLNFGDDHLGTQAVVIDPVEMIWLSQQPLKHYKIQLNYHLVSTHSGGGAKYQVFYKVAQGSNGPVFKWTNIGGAAKNLYAGGAGFFATNPATGELFRFEGTGKPWTKVSGPGAEFAVTHHDLFSLSPDRSSVSRMTSPGKWEKVGGPASHLVGGGATLFAQSPGTNGAISRYDGSPNKWTNVGGPGSEFAANNLTLYGLTPDRGAVYEYQGTPGKWTAIGGPASKIIAGGSFFFALTPNGDSIWRYEGQPFKWTKVGGPGNSFAACDAGLFGLAPNKADVWWHVGPPDQWIRVGSAAGSIAAGGNHLYATTPTFGGVFMME